MKLAILDDYQRLSLGYADWKSLKGVEVVVFDEPLKDPAKQLAPFDVVCLMRERTPFPRALIAKLPNLKFVSLTGEQHALRRRRAVDGGADVGPDHRRGAWPGEGRAQHAIGAMA